MPYFSIILNKKRSGIFTLLKENVRLEQLFVRLEQVTYGQFYLTLQKEMAKQ